MTLMAAAFMRAFSALLPLLFTVFILAFFVQVAVLCLCACLASSLPRHHGSSSRDLPPLLLCQRWPPACAEGMGIHSWSARDRLKSAALVPRNGSASERLAAGRCYSRSWLFSTPVGSSSSWSGRNDIVSFRGSALSLSLRPRRPSKF